MRKTVDLLTKSGETLQSIPWQVYPRPQLKRDSFFCLNGNWDFCESKSDTIPDTFGETIRVPYPPESVLSGIHRTFKRRTYLFYRRTFSLPDEFIDRRVLLHFGAVDQHAAVYLNGHLLGKHHGGYQAFSFDITDQLQAKNTLVVRARDDLHDRVLPYGKQCEKPHGMWYTPTSGIWQTVWCESVPDTYVRSLHIRTAAESVQLTAEGIDTATVTVQTPHGELTAPMLRGRASIVLSNPRTWSPEDPYLYHFTIKTDADTVSSYFAMRTLSVETVDGIPRLCLNGTPYFFHGLLDQGYYSDGLFLPATPDGYEQDILAMKSLGFNTLRKHIKVEPEQFYYDCDRLGMIVFQDMINNGGYSFIRDTALPTVGLQTLDDRRLHRDPATRRAFLEGMVQTVTGLYNHPCICYWTIFNEGWGQFDSAAVYEQFRKLDTSRFIDTASGWFAGAPSDVDSRHVYFKPFTVPPPSDRPLVLSEFGGYAYPVDNHVFCPSRSYGYRSFTSADALEDAIVQLYETQILPAVPKGLCAAIYTQVSDVEEEINGLLTYDRKVCKVSSNRLRDLANRLQQTIHTEP